MLSRLVSDKRTTMEVPWDAARAARVLERAVRARRSRSQKRPIGWMLALAGASLVAAFFVRRPLPSNGDAAETSPLREPRPTIVSTPSDALDGGKQTG
jgi:hypothetical protein